VSFAGHARKRLLMPADDEVTFARRGFTVHDDGSRRRLEEVGRSFLSGLAPGLAGDSPAAIDKRLRAVPVPLRGFAFEGAAMGLAIGDALSPWRRPAVADFAAGPASPHIYMTHIGIGWALARLPRPLWRRPLLPDRVLRWLVLDGYGFHQAYFATDRYVRRTERPRVRAPWPDPHRYAARAVDQGIGRALWFVAGADVDEASRLVCTFAPARRADLWSGVGLAATYAAGADVDALGRLVKLAGAHRPELAQGAAFAAKARLRAGLVTAETVEAVGVICETGLAAAALVTDDALAELPDGDGPAPAFEVWRQRIRSNFAHLNG
jgi:hypothetical protein